MSSEKSGTSSSVSSERRKRSKKANKLSIALLGLFVVVSAGGALWYWTQVLVPEREKQEYEQETIRIEGELSAVVRQLTEWTTEAALDRYSKEISLLGTRDGVQKSFVEALAAKVDALKEARIQRMQRFQALLEEARGFPNDSSREAVLGFDDRILKALGEFEKKLGEELKQQWSIRRKEIASYAKSLNPGELTIRTDPSKATVYMDGKLLATTPFTVAQVRPGKHELVMKKEGYLDKAVSIRMEESGQVDLGIQELEAIVGSLRIKVKGGKSRDRIEIELEEFSETTTVGGLEVVQGYRYMTGREHSLKTIRIGEYVIRVTRNGSEVDRRNVVVEAGKTVELLVEL